MVLFQNMLAEIVRADHLVFKYIQSSNYVSSLPLLTRVNVHAQCRFFFQQLEKMTILCRLNLYSISEVFAYATSFQDKYEPLVYHYELLMIQVQMFIQLRRKL